MKIKEIYMEGFGHFHQRNIGPMMSPITIIHGPNETGKTTLLAFIRTMLFGFPRIYKNFYPPGDDWRHGGRISLLDGAGDDFVVERFTGKGGKAKVTTPNGIWEDGDMVLGQLIGNISLDIFKSVFAFNLDELQAGGLLQEEGVKEYIYGAALGAPQLPSLSKSLHDRHRAIFLLRGRNQKVPKVLAELRALDSSLEKVEDNAARYGNLRVRQDELRQELEENNVEYRRMVSNSSYLKNLQKGWEDWVKLADCESRMEEISWFESFPNDALLLLDRYEENLRQTRKARDEITDQLWEVQEDAEMEIADESLVEDRDLIERIRRGRSGFDNSVRDLSKRKGELDILERDFSDRLVELDPNWDEARLDSFDISLGVHNEVEQWKRKLKDNCNAERQTEIRLKQEQRQLHERQEEYEEAWQILPTSPPLSQEALNSRRANLRTARSHLNSYQAARQNHNNLCSQLERLPQVPEQELQRRKRLALPILLGLVGAVLTVRNFLLQEEGSLAVMISGGLLLIGAAYLFLREQRKPMTISGVSTLVKVLEGQIDDARGLEETEKGLLYQTATMLELNQLPDVAILDDVESELVSFEKDMTVWNGAKARMTEAERRLNRQKNITDRVSDERRKIEEGTRNLQQDWEAWLRKKKVPETFTTDTMIEFLARVKVVLTKCQEVRQMRHRVSAIEADITEYLDLVKPLADKCGDKSFLQDYHQVGTLADSFIKRFDNAYCLVQQREKAQQLVDKYRQKLKQREQDLMKADQKVQEHIFAGGTDDSEEFRLRAQQNAEHCRLEQRRDEHLSRLRILSGPGKKLEIFREILSRSDPNQLQEEIVLASQEVDNIKATRDDLQREVGRIENELAQLTDEKESSILRATYHIRLEQLRGHAYEWSRLKLAEWLLEKTRQKFEQERQPSVIRHAQGFFSSVTGGRYRRLYAPLGEQTITVEDATGATKEPRQLSRGTREQLYLALRFGLIREFGEHTECLPVVVDEILVNFDPNRALQAVAAFVELSRTNQVLVFTCHPEVVETFRRVTEESGSPHPQLIDIG